jgi:hypothetical protein
MIANDSSKLQIRATARVDSFLVCLVPARQGAKPLLNLRAGLPWAPFTNALPPLIPLMSAVSKPSTQSLKAAREALRGGFCLSQAFYQAGITWLRVSPAEKLSSAQAALAQDALGQHIPPAEAQVGGTAENYLIPILPALYLGPGELPPSSKTTGQLALGAWRLRVYAFRYLTRDPRSAFSSEVVYDRPVYKTMPHTASHFGPENL